jgi:hypothetical protein
MKQTAEAGKRVAKRAASSRAPLLLVVPARVDHARAEGFFPSSYFSFILLYGSTSSRPRLARAEPRSGRGPLVAPPAPAACPVRRWREHGANST